MTPTRRHALREAELHAPARGFGAPRDDEYFMAVALALARYAEPAPNPRVGALVVRQGVIVGSGYHARAGAAHAEVAALHGAGALAADAALYVTLEPCNHFGRTPPCVGAIERARVGRVVVGCVDPNAQVRGGGIQRLRELGIEVVVGVCEKEAAELIAPWLQSLAGPRGPSLRAAGRAPLCPR